MKLWTVAVVDRSEPDNEILWISVFTSKQKAYAFAEAAEQKLKDYDVYPLTDIVTEECRLNDDSILDLIDNCYGCTQQLESS